MRPKIRVDFNELVEPNLVLLAKNDTAQDASGAILILVEGMKISVFDDDANDRGEIDNLIANGTVELNKSKESWALHVKWCCRIDSDGIQHESELTDSKK